MTRLHLRIYQPPSEPEVSNDPADEPHVIPFAKDGAPKVISGRLPLDRARILRQNRQCPECSRHDVEPIELQDAVISPRNRLPVPGTATIVGFRCNSCATEWPVYELTTRRNG